MKKYLKWLWLIPIILIIGVIGYFFLAIYILGSDSNYVDIKESFRVHYDRRNELIQLVETYQLEYDETGLIANLEQVGFSGLASNDRVYVKYQEEELIVEFVINGGMPDEGQSLVYSSSGEELLKEHIYDYAYVEKIEDKWYKVQYN